MYGSGSTVKIECDHGFFRFYETSQGEIARFLNIFSGFSLQRSTDHFIFKALADAETYSIAGMEYLGNVATETLEGKPWEIMRANGLVYDFSKDLVVPIASVTLRTKLIQASKYFSSPGLILPGSVTDGGSRVTEYVAWYSFKDASFRYSEVNLE